MKHGGLLLLVLASSACGPSSPPSAPTSDARLVPDREPLPKEESLEDGARAFFEALVAGDRKEALARTLSFDEMASISKKADDREEYDAEIGKKLSSLLDDLAKKNVAVVGVRVVRRRVASASENPEKVKRDVELAAIAVTLAADGKTHEVESFTFVKMGPRWKFSTKNA